MCIFDDYSHEYKTRRILDLDKILLAACHAEVFGDEHDSTSSQACFVFMATCMETAFDCSFLIMSFLLVLLWGVTSSEESPDSMDH